jgi:cell division protein FtsN
MPAKQHYLQVGSFSTPQEADNRKAELAMQGQEASVRQVMVQDKTYYRVVLGPFPSVNEINRLRSALARTGVESVPLNQE